MAVPAVVLAVATLAALVWLGAHVVRYLVAGKELRPVLRVAWRIKHTWGRTARRVGLVQTERIRPPWWSNRPPGTIVPRELIPAVTVAAERWGGVDASTVGRLGVEEFSQAAGHLADVWRVPLVRVAQVRPGLVRIRALLHDPLTEPATGPNRQRSGRIRRCGSLAWTPTASRSPFGPLVCPAWWWPGWRVTARRRS
ncbi:hypothetical protein OOK41_03585 [Micromonospora sp. NBC_01655]|uniref:hypothetical protein n=1 Tax=Micromonospora sp. NBC_01655 TaxID=2975983 RepID=UPI00225902F6|nr:hypothetical protein [Micromonospora sp. NBC_01655]MCX4469398.1 hypothetical protein [Micromonospora sp. NBC_01655]